MLHYLEGEGASLISNFFHQRLLHWSVGWVSSYRWIYLHTLYPDVPPEGQANHIQVFAAITEGTSKVDKYCKGNGHTLTLVCILGTLNSDAIRFNFQKTGRERERSTFSAIKICGVHFNHPIYKREDR